MSSVRYEHIHARMRYKCKMCERVIKTQFALVTITNKIECIAVLLRGPGATMEHVAMRAVVLAFVVGDDRFEILEDPYIGNYWTRKL